jgi:NAD(P)-dependent dehydrogenase (short-subunit alcohol dehydrogenase family)
MTRVEWNRISVPDLDRAPISELISLHGRSAVVTGGAQGLGRAISRRLAEAGASVLIGDRNLSAAEATAREISEEAHATVIAAEADVSRSEEVSALADFALDKFGNIDIWVNNAGIYPDTPVLDITDSQWDQVSNINLRGTFFGAREAARRMTASGRAGVIVNVASCASFKAQVPGIAHYVATKHGVRGLTSSMALELGPYGIRVLAVAPTVMLTPGVEDKRARAAADPNDPRRGEQPGPSLLGRPGVPDDVARVVLFCASDLSMFMTGSILPVDAGDLTK